MQQKSISDWADAFLLRISKNKVVFLDIELVFAETREVVECREC